MKISDMGRLLALVALMLVLHLLLLLLLVEATALSGAHLPALAS
jgi:hypothetical protein